MRQESKTRATRILRAVVAVIAGRFGIGGSGAAHAGTTSYNLPFAATGLGMWHTGTSDGVNFSQFEGTTWNASGSAGSISNNGIFGSYGLKVGAETDGKIGVNVNAQTTDGSVDVNYPAQVTLSLPDSITNAGTYTISPTSSTSLSAGQNFLSSHFPNLSFGIDGVVQAHVNVGGTVAVYKAFSGNVDLLNINTTFPIVSYNENNNNAVTVFGTFTQPLQNGITIPLGQKPIVDTTYATVTGPQVGTMNIRPVTQLNANSGTLFTTTASQSQVLTLSADLLGIVSKLDSLPINPFDVKASLLGVGSVQSKILSVQEGIAFGLQQNLTLVPELHMVLHSSQAVTYAGTTTGTNTYDTVIRSGTTPAGNISFSKGAGDVALFPEFYLSATLQNQLNLTLAPALSVTAGQFSFKAGSYSTSLGPIFQFKDASDVFATFPVYNQQLDLTNAGGLQVHNLEPSLTPLQPMELNIDPKASYVANTIVGSFNTTAIAGTLTLSANSLYQDNSAVAVTGSLTLSGTSNFLTPQLTNTGQVTINSGTLSATTLTNAAGGTLSAGTFSIAGRLAYGGPNITNIASGTSLTLSGAGIHLANGAADGMATITKNAGTLTYGNVGTFSTGSAFTNTGTFVLTGGNPGSTFNSNGFTNAAGGLVQVDSGSLLNTAGTGGAGVFGNMNGTTLTAGTFVVGGSINYTGSNISTIASGTSLTLATKHIPDGLYLKRGSVDGLAALIRNNGTLTLASSAAQTITGSLTNNGVIDAFTGSTLTIGSFITNSATGQIFVSGGTLAATTLTNNGQLTVDHQGNIFLSSLVQSIGNFTNTDPDAHTATLSGGVWNLTGTIFYNDAYNIKQIAAGTTVTVVGGQGFFNQGLNQPGFFALAQNSGTLNLQLGGNIASTNALSNSGTITLTGTSSTLSFKDSLSNTGAISVGFGNTLDSRGGPYNAGNNFSNVNASGVLTNVGNLSLAGQLQYQGPPITTLGTGVNLTLDGPVQTPIRRYTGQGDNTGSDGLANLQKITGRLNLINGAVMATTTLGGVTLAGTLTTDSQSGLYVRDGAILTVASPSSVTNAGRIFLGSAAAAHISISGPITLSGGGTIEMSNFAATSITSSPSDSLFNADNTIEGAGIITVPLTNFGTIQSTGSQGLILQPASGEIDNAGVLRSYGIPQTLVNGTGAPLTISTGVLTIKNALVMNVDIGGPLGVLDSQSEIVFDHSQVGGGKILIENQGIFTLKSGDLSDASVITNSFGGIIRTVAGGGNGILGGPITNAGLLQVASATSITIQSSVNNSGAVDLAPGSILAGMLTTSGVLTASAGPGTATLTKPIITTSTGLVAVDGGMTLLVPGGTQNNAGQIQLGSTLGAGTISFSGSTTFSGGGIVQFGAPADSTVAGQTISAWSGVGTLTGTSGITLANLNNTIQGQGTIGAGGAIAAITNSAAGTIYANASGTSLTVAAGTTGFTNQGTLQVAAGAKLVIPGGHFNNFAGNTLTGGSYLLAGPLAFDGASITTDAGSITLIGNGGTITDQFGANALANLNAISAGANLNLIRGKSLTLAAPTFINSGSITLGGSGTSAGGTLSIQSLAGASAASINLADPTASLIVNSGNSTYGGTIVGAGFLTKAGTGTLLLTGANTYTGGTSVAAGTLSVQGNALASPSVNISSGATFQYDFPVYTIIYGTLSGAGTFRKVGVGDLVFGGFSTGFNVSLSAGAVVDVQAGTLISSSNFQGNWAGNLASVNVAAGATFEAEEGGPSGTHQLDALTGAGTVQGGLAGIFGGITTVRLGVANTSGTFSGVITNDDGHLAIIKTGTGTQVFSGDNNYSGGTTISGGTLQIGQGTASGSIVGDVVNNSILAFDRSTNSTYSGVISGSGAVTKAGSGTLRLAGANSYSGPTTVAAGALALGPSGSLATSGVTLLSGATFAGASNSVFARPVIVPAAASATLASLHGNSGPTIFTGAITLNGNLTLRADNDSPNDSLHETGVTRIDGGITGAGSLTIAAAAGMIQFRNPGAKDYTGDTLVMPGATFSHYNSASTPFNSTVRIDAGGTVILEGVGNASFGNLADGPSGGGQLIHNFNWGTSSILTIGGNSTSTTYSGSIGAGIQIIKTGTGTLTLAGQASGVGLHVAAGAGVVALAPNSPTSTLNLLDLAANTTLNVTDNDLVISYSGISPVATIRSYLTSGFNQGNWNGAGIDSSTAHNNPAFLTGVGYSDTGSSVIVKYTYYGDSNLDGHVAVADFQDFLDGLVTGANSWSQGDYTYDGKVDLGNDFNLFLVGYLHNGGALGDLGPLVAADNQLTASQKSTLLAVVPEPSGILAMSLAAGGIASRRRRRQ